jgi:hypothetical protein
MTPSLSVALKQTRGSFHGVTLLLREERLALLAGGDAPWISRSKAKRVWIVCTRALLRSLRVRKE